MGVIFSCSPLIISKLIVKSNFASFWAIPPSKLLKAPWWSSHHTLDLNLYTHHISWMVLDPLYPTQAPLMNNKQPVKLQLLCAGIYARLQPSETPSAQRRLSDQTITAVQVLTPVTWGFTFANHRLSLQISIFTLLHCRSISDAAALQMQPQCSSQWDELPNCTDTPIVRLAASSTACNGVEATLVCPNVSNRGDSVPDYLQAWDRNVIFESFCNESINIFHEFTLWIAVYWHYASSETEAMNVSLTLLFL